MESPNSSPESRPTVEDILNPPGNTSSRPPEEQGYINLRRIWTRVHKAVQEFWPVLLVVTLWVPSLCVFAAGLFISLSNSEMPREGSWKNTHVNAGRALRYFVNECKQVWPYVLILQTLYSVWVSGAPTLIVRWVGYLLYNVLYVCFIWRDIFHLLYIVVFIKSHFETVESILCTSWRKFIGNTNE